MKGMDLNLAQAAQAMGVAREPGWAEVNLSGVSADSRTIEPGQLFIALRGMNFDGHDFVGKALEKGAAAVVLDKNVQVEGGKRLVVQDTLKALGDLASAVRLKKRKKPLKIIAVTGSNGKTTTKEMLSRILAQSFNTLTNPGNFNNLIGLPLTLCGLKAEHEAAILEMGMNEFGEIARLTEIASPNVGLITNVGPAHIEKLGSIEGVARAKGELFLGLASSAVAAVNIDDPLVMGEAQKFKGEKITFGFSKQAKVTISGRPEWRLSGAKFTLKLDALKMDIRFNLLGRHNVANALAAAAGALAFGLKPEDIAKGLDGFQSFPGRLELKKLPGPLYVLDDTYNANPASAFAAFTVLKSLGRGKGRLVAAMGDMLELGRVSRFEHDLLGRSAAAMGLDALIAVGQESKFMAKAAKKFGLTGDKVHWFSDTVQAADWLKRRLKPHDMVLVKGSRGMRMESIVRRLSGENEA